MGNIGRSSTGCYQCRKRKIKCDERKEGGCRKCEQIKKKCPGYPFVVELDVKVDHDGTLASLALPESDSKQIPAISVPLQLKAESKSELCVAEIHSEREESPMVKCKCATTKVVLNLVPRYTAPTPPPTYDVQHQSICFFLNIFCYQATRTYGAPILDYLPEMLRRSQSNSCIQQATKAVSRFTLADRYSGRDIRLETGKDYVDALSMTNQTIRNSKGVIEDETVVAVWLLGLYEAINSVLSHGRVSKDHRTAEEEWQSHVSHLRGAMNLLRIRGESQFETPRAEKIYRIFKAAIQMRLFMLNTVTSTDFDNLEQDIYQDDHEFLPSKTAVKATIYFHGVAELLESAKYALRRFEVEPESPELAGEMQRILRQGESLDAEMVNWSKNEPGWDMMKVQDSTTGTMWSFYPSHAMYFFNSVWVFLYWLRYLIARIKLYEGLITIVERQNSAQSCRSCGTKPTSRMDFKISQFRTLVQLTAGQIIGLTAYALGDVTNEGKFHVFSSSIGDGNAHREINAVAAMQLVIPLKVLQRSSLPTVTQKGAIDLALSHIGDGFRRQPRPI